MVKGKASATHLRNETVKRAPAANTQSKKKAAPVFGEGVKLAAIQHPHLKKVIAKTEPSHDDEQSTQPMASIIDLDDDSEHFVRGRAAVSKSSTHRETDNLFTSHKRKAESSTDKSITQGKSKKTKTKPQTTDDAEAEELIAKATAGDDEDAEDVEMVKPASIGERKISVLKSRLFTPGFTVIGSIDRLMDLEAIVSLPNGHVGHLALREVSQHVSAAVDAFLEAEEAGKKSSKSKQSVTSLPKLSDYLRVGEVWPFSVLSAVTPTGAHRIELSLKSQSINQSITSSMLSEGVQLMGTVHSIEEKGYTVELGVSDSAIQGFLSFKDAPVSDIRNRSVSQSDNQSIKSEDVNEDAQFEVGQPIICRVTKLSSRIISLTARPDIVMQTGATVSRTQNFSSLLPGSLYPLTVDAADLDGYHCSCASFTASVDVLHMPTVPPQPIALKQAIKPGTAVLGRLLYADKRLKVLSFTLHPRVVKEARGLVGAPIALGDYVEARVHRIEGNAGVWFRCKKITREVALKRFNASQSSKEAKTKKATKSGKKSADKEQMEDESDAEKESDNEETESSTKADADSDDEADVEIETDNSSTDGPEWMLGFCRAKWLDDVAITKVARKFPYAAVRVARVTSVDSFDSIVRLSLQSNQIEKKIVSIADVTEGEFVEGTIASIEPFGILVQLAPALKGLIPMMHFADISINQTIKSLPKRFRVGKTIKARVLTVDAKGKRIIMTVKPSMMTTHDAPVTSYDQIQSNMLMSGFITAAEPYGLIVQFYGHVHGLVSVKTLIKEGLIDPDQQTAEKAIKETWNKGDSIRVRVANVQADKRKLYLSLKLKVDESKKTKVKVEKVVEDEDQPIKLEAGSIGSIVEGKVQKVMPGMGLLISANDHTIGVVNVTNVADHWTSKSLDQFSVNQAVRVKVLDVATQPDGKKKVNLSMRSSDLEKTGSSSRTSLTLSDFIPGSLVMGIVKRTDPKGCFVWLTDTLIGRILIKDLSDRHVADPIASFPPGELVRARVVSVDTENQSISLTMRRSADSRVKFEDLTVGAKVKGEVKAIKPFGLFIRLSHSQLDGLAHITECIEQPAKQSKDAQSVDELSSHYKVGDRVRAVVLKLDPVTKKISLAVKESHFADETVAELAAAEIDSEDDEEPINQSHNPSSITSEELLKSPVPSFNSPVIAGVKAQSTSQSIRQLIEDFDAAPALDLNAVDDDEEMDEEDDSLSTTLSAAPVAKLSQAARRSEVEQREHALVDPAMKPQTSADFDRLILAQPNSSINYIQLMAYHIDAGAIDQARAVGEKALVAIDYREDKERLNVWLALIGLERTHGSAQSTQTMIEKACQRSDERAVLAAVAEMFGVSGDVDGAVKFYQRLVKEYSDDKNSWLQFARFMYSAGRVDTARALLVTCLAKLHASHHIEVMERFAKLEASHIKQGGSMERARTMLEQLMHQHPKRLDLINVFIDLETSYLNSFTSSDKARSVAAGHLRTLFERVTSRTWSSKKMKFLLKRNLEFEQQFGDAKKVEAVKDKARKYVESKGAAKDEDDE